MALTDVKAKNAKTKEKDYKLSDEKGLFLLVKTTGSKYWRHKYYFGGKEKLSSLGVYPEVSLKEARNKRDVNRKLLSDGIDPSVAKRAHKATQTETLANSFECISREWYARKLPTWAETTAKKRLALLENDLLPWLGPLPISEVTALDLLKTLQRIENRGAKETAHHGRQVAGEIFRYARLTQRCIHDPAQDLRGALAPRVTKHRPAITEPKELGNLLIAIDQYKGTHIVRSLLALCPILFQRPGEMIAMEWGELDLETAEWNIPADKMKMKQPHLIPLPHQAVAILLDLQPLTGNRRHVFPGQRKPSTHHVSNGTINKALQNMGIDTKTTHCAHGFRATARTMLDEQLGYSIGWIEQQLAHQVRDPLGRAYNRTAHLAQRKEMMQRWADYLHELRNI